MRTQFPAGGEVQLDIGLPGGVWRACFTSVVAAGPDRLVLRAPVDDDGSPFCIPPGAEVKLYRRQGETIYAAKATALAEEPCDEPVLVISVPLTWEKTTRREYFRVDVNLPMRIYGRSGEVRNLSGNGLLAAVPPGVLCVGRTYDIEFKVPGISRPFRAGVRVVRISPGEEELVGMTFESLTRRAREDLIRFIFRRQRELIHEREAD